MSNRIAATKLWENATLDGSGTLTSQAIDIQGANAFSLHISAIAGTSPNVTFSYLLAPSLQGTYTAPQDPTAIASNVTAADVLAFDLEYAAGIKIVATNNGTGAVVLTTHFTAQEVA